MSLADKLYLPLSSVTGVSWPALPHPRDIATQALLYQLDQSQWWPPSLLLQRQLEQAVLLLQHARDTSPFYRGKLDGFLALQSQKQRLDAWRDLPILTRQDVQRSKDQLVTTALPKSHGTMFDIQTSGSTGRPVWVKGTRLTGLFYRTLALRSHFWHERDFNGKDLTIRTLKGKRGMPKAPVRLSSWASGYQTGESLLMDIRLPTDTLMKHVLKEDPDYLQTHPSTVKALIERSVEVGQIPKNLRDVRTFGEVVNEDLRTLCRRVWNVPLIDNYSATELGGIALQCPEHEHYHVQSESLLVEVLDPAGKPCGTGQVGRIVVTVLHNFATPLIRYELGDYAEVGDPCSCGRGLPVLRRILGRVRNQVVLPDGRNLHPAFSSEVLFSIAPILQYQLTQKTLNDIEVKLVMARPLNNNEREALSDYFSENFQHQFNYVFHFVDDIPRSDNGKFEIFRSEIIQQ